MKVSGIVIFTMLIMNNEVYFFSIISDYQFLFIGSEDGNFSVATDAEARWKLFSSAMRNTALLGGITP